MPRPARLIALALAALTVGTLAAASGTAHAEGEAPGSTTRQALTSSDIERAYLLHLPRKQVANPPLVIALHGRYQSPTSMLNYTGLAALSDSTGFVLALPGAYGGGWNAGQCCSTGQTNNIPDVTFLDDLIGEMTATRGINPRRVYVTGFSNGGMMAYRFACERSHMVAGIAVVSGAMMADASYASPRAPYCRPSAPVSVLHVHGNKDTTVKHSGGHQPGLGGTASSAPGAVNTVAAVSQCRGTSKRKVGQATHVEHTNCQPGTRAKYVSVNGLNHAWTRDSKKYGIDTTVAVWKYLAPVSR